MTGRRTALNIVLCALCVQDMNETLYALRANLKNFYFKAYWAK